DEWFTSRKVPLMIGGATTSRVHTAVKIAPHYEGPVVYTPDASRAGGVAQNLVSEERREAYLAELAKEYDLVRQRHANRRKQPLVTLAEARANRPVIDWEGYVPPKPKFLGRREFKHYDLAEIAQYIDWGPFFQTWDLHGGFPGILEDAVVGE